MCSESDLKQRSRVLGSTSTKKGAAATDRQVLFIVACPCGGSGPVFHKDATFICRPAPRAIRCAASQHR